jgi:hypothetical protein
MSFWIHSGTFANALEYKANDGEHPVEFFEVYRDYLNRFEAKIEDFIRDVRLLCGTTFSHDVMLDGICPKGLLCRV